MKNYIFLLPALCLACANIADPEAEKSAISKLIDDETRYAASVDLENWARCWIADDEARFSITSSEGSQQYHGWKNIEAILKDAQPFDLKLKRDNYHYSIGEDIAFLSFDQEDNWAGIEGRKTRESRTLRKIDGEWKIVDANVIALSSFDKPKHNSYHVKKENIPVGMKAEKTVMRSQGGLGGMVVAFNEVPAGGDMTALFEGLPGNACIAPHWGYILEGAIRIKYADGKEETVNAGEVFYWPAGHIPYVEKDLKLIDFSPEAELNEVMAHIGKKMAAQQ